MPVDVGRLRKQCVYDSKAPLQIVAGDLDEIVHVAADWRRTRKRRAFRGVVTMIAGIACMVASVAVGPFLIPIGIALFAASTALFVSAYRHGRAVVNNVGRCEIAKALGQTLSDDIDPISPVEIHLEFDPKRELVAESAWPMRQNGKQKLFRATWLSLQARLLDGATFSESIDDLIRQRSYRNPRGKSKMKTRTRQAIALSLGYPPDIYGNAGALGSLFQREIKLPPSASLRGLEANDRRIKTKALITQSADLVQANSALVLGVYRVLNLSRKLVAAQRNRAPNGGIQ